MKREQILSVRVDLYLEGRLNSFDRVASIKRGANDFLLDITKTYLYNFDSLKPHFSIVKLGFIGVYVIFLISAQKQIVGTR